MTGVAVVLCASPAQAEPVIVVGLGQVERVDDPFVPAPSDIDLGPAPGRPRVRAHSAAQGRQAVGRALALAAQRRGISPSDYSRYRRTYRRGRATLGRLSGARKRELGYVVRSVERVALAGRLTATRMPSIFLQLRRNSAYWPNKAFPATGDQLTFRGSELLYQYFPGRGLQLHPLSNFKKANNLNGACVTRKPGKPVKPVCGARPPGPTPGTPCRPERLRHLLDELAGLTVQRHSGFVAWEYLFDFGGGSPPWMSGMAQSVAVSALTRGARRLNRPDYAALAERALGAFETPSPVGVRTRGPLGGVHYLQYSFAPRLYIFNAFLQSLIGLHDYGRLARSPRATALFQQGEPEAKREVPYSSTGNWSRYSFRGAKSTGLYHELLRESLQSMGLRLGKLGGIYCRYAVRYRQFQDRRR